ncbi:MAG: type II toxin-antitoxin system RelE/ParE family toxin [Acetobacteraceae bacterium]|nr:type II toxin-antitoxin system RelE/ParE family toxin [Acetobacteraceae bacterium]
MQADWSPKARKQLRKLELSNRRRILARMDAYVEQPRGAHHDVVPIVGQPDTYRMRVGDWRIVFTLNGDGVMVVQVAHRREAYR